MALLAPELAADVTSLSQFAEFLDSVPRLPVGLVRFEFDLHLQMAVGIAILGVVVSVAAWAVRVAPASGAVPPAVLVGMAGENSGSSWWKTTWHSTRAALAVSELFSPMLIARLG